MGKSPKVSKSKSNSGKKRKRRHRSPDAVAVMKLLEYAALGKTRRMRKLLDRGGEQFPIDAYDAAGWTALHHACRHGHADAAQLLLSRGADIDAEELTGNSPLHLVASSGHLTLLSALLQVSPAPDIDRRNAKGITVRSLAAAAMHQADIDDWRSGQPAAMSSDEQPSSREASPADERDPETVWRDRLAAEGDEGGGANPWAGGGWGEAGWEEGMEADQPGVPWGGAGESEDQFAARIWAEMQRRKNAGAEAAAKAYNAEKEKAAARRQAAESEAYQRSKQILEAEVAKDRAWRDAVRQGDLGVRRARYEARWHAFAASAAAAGGSTSVAYAAVPWLADQPGGDIEPLVLYGTSGKEEQRKRLRLELMRWHPDKFHARFVKRIAAGDRERVLERVEAQTKALNALAAKQRG